MEPLSPAVNARNVRRFTAARLALLGYVPDYQRGRARRRAIRRNELRGRSPRFVRIEWAIVRGMARHLGETVTRAQEVPSNARLRDLIRMAAPFAVCFYQQLGERGPVADGTALAVLDVIRYLVERLVERCPPEPGRVQALLPALLTGLTDENLPRGSRALAAALRRLYRVRTVADRVVESQWALAGSGLAVGVGGYLVAAR